MRWEGHVARMGEGRGVYRVLVEKPEGRRPLGRPWRRWEDNIKMDLQEVCCGAINWIELAQDRHRWRAVVNADNEPSGSIKCGELWFYCYSPKIFTAKFPYLHQSNTIWSWFNAVSPNGSRRNKFSPRRTVVRRRVILPLLTHRPPDPLNILLKNTQ